MKLIARIRFQLLGGIFVAVFLPAFLRWNFGYFEIVSQQNFGNSIIATLLALVVGYFVLRQLLAYPGVQATIYILPTFAIVYAVLLAVFIFLRIDYSRYQILASFTLAIVWFYAVYLLGTRHVRPVYGLVPGGNSRNITQMKSIDWLELREPDLGGRYVDAVIADLRSDLPAHWVRFIADVSLKGVPVYHVKQATESLTGKVEIEHLSENSLGSVLPSVFYARIKRIVDIAGVAVAAPVFLVVTAIAAIAVKLDSPGPAFFCQKRMGFRGNSFTIYKLRTMRTEQDDTPSFTTSDDPRITRLGQFLRKYRIDEFPQIVNIARGDMSWIGPRPEAMELSRWYEQEIPFYVYRHIVRPGITGWAQVQQGNVAEVEAATYKLQYDFFYIKHFSAWLDILIVAKTLKTIATGFGSR